MRGSEMFEESIDDRVTLSQLGHRLYASSPKCALSKATVMFNCNDIYE